jgi:hypothetical protein
MPKSKSSTSSVGSVEALQAQLAALQAQIASLTAEKRTISAESVGRFTLEHWVTLQAAMIQNGTTKGSGTGMKATGDLSKERKGYALRKGILPKWYMAVRGFANTLRYQAENGLPVGLHTEPNDKGRTQVQYAQEILDELVENGVIEANSPLLTGESKRKPGRPRKA